MATYDNKIWLLKNIRNAFIATDDTGLCEIVMAGEDLSKIFLNKALDEKKKLRDEMFYKPGSSKRVRESAMGDISEDEFDREVVTQFDAYPDMEESDEDDFVCGSYILPEVPGRPRPKSPWLDKKEQALKKAAKIKIIKWENGTQELPSEEKADLFAKYEIKKPSNKKSLLTEQLENCPELPHRQYLEYGKFDGTAQLGLPTKVFKIFMTMLPEKHQNYPLVVCVIANAKIKDLIGFTCYKYSIEHPEIILGSVNDYGLCIAEDDGEVDLAFPCLEACEPCSKFGFTCLGLVELKRKNALNKDATAIPDDGETFRMIFPKPDSGQSHQNPSRHNTGGSATSEAVLHAIQALSNDKKGGDNYLNKLQTHIAVSEAPQYKVYRVHLLRKVRTNIPVQLGISIDRIEIEPLVPNKHAFWSKSKYFLHSIDSVAWCQILESRGNRSNFKIIYAPGQHAAHLSSGSAGFFHPANYKHHDFECDNEMAREIVDKVNTILDSRNSPCRREYKTAKEKKLQTRRSFHTRNLS